MIALPENEHLAECLEYHLDFEVLWNDEHLIEFLDTKINECRGLEHEATECHRRRFDLLGSQFFANLSESTQQRMI